MRNPSRFVCAFLAALAACAICSCPAAAQDVLTFDVAVSPTSARYTDLLARPPFLAVALENIGVRPSNSARPVIVDRQTLRLGAAQVRFLRKEGPTFHYEGTIEWSIGVTRGDFRLPIEANLSELGAGKVLVRVHLPMAKLFPQALTDRIRAKVQSLADPATQKRLLDYLDALAKKAPPAQGTDVLIERLMIDAYNRSLSPGSGGLGEPGDAVPLSDQKLFIGTVAIWFILLPLAVLARRFWRRRRQAQV